MNLTNLRYQDAEKSGVLGELDGRSFVAPPESRLWREAHRDVKSKPIAGFVPEPATPKQITEKERLAALWEAAANNDTTKMNALKAREAARV